MEITTDVKTHVIVTMQGGHYFITERLNKQLEQMSLDDMLVTDEGVQVKVSTIVEVLPIEQYYTQYPSKRPEPRVPHIDELNLDDLPAMGWEAVAGADYPSYSRGRRIRALQAMIKGVEKVIAEKGHAPKATALRDSMRKRLEILESGGKPTKADAVYTPQFVFDQNKETWAEFSVRAGLNN